MALVVLVAMLHSLKASTVATGEHPKARIDVNVLDVPDAIGAGGHREEHR